MLNTFYWEKNVKVINKSPKISEIHIDAVLLETKAIFIIRLF